MVRPKLAIDTFVGTKLTEPIGSHESTDKERLSEPEWAKAARRPREESARRITILQWVRNAVVAFYTRVPYNKIRRHWGFTCTECESRGWRALVKRRWPWSRDLDGTINRQYLPRRCTACGTKHTRYKRARHAMKKIFRSLTGNQVCWFVTLTKPNRLFQAGDTVDLEADKAAWIAEFRKFRQRKVWKDTFAGGYWFYEYTVHKPGDKIFDKRGNFLRQCKTFELNGHLHILTTSSPRIPMQELAADWDGRMDMRRKDEKTNIPLNETTVLRYLRGYLTKTDMPGAVNMRPFGNIHRSRGARQ